MGERAGVTCAPGGVAPEARLFCEHDPQRLTNQTHSHLPHQTRHSQKSSGTSSTRATLVGSSRRQEMDKAAQAVRRGTVRLSSSLGSGHSALKLIISEKKSVRNALKAFVRAQQSGNIKIARTCERSRRSLALAASSYVSKWAETEESDAIQDVATNMAELNACWTEIQKEMIEDMKQNAILYEKILDSEKALDHAKKQVDHCLGKEKKIKKDIEKAEKKGDDVMGLQSKLKQAQQASELAQAELRGRSHEAQCIKMAYFQTAVKEYAQSFQNLASKASVLFQAQEKLAALLPETQSRDMSAGVPQYTGSQEASAIVSEAKGQLRTSQLPLFLSSSPAAAEDGGGDDVGMTAPPPSYSAAVQRSRSLPSSAGRIVKEEAAGGMQEEEETLGWGSDEFSD
ncbi:uncharacterized protein [Oscarella lobularis]|uniref:uncharacterized protein isoform X2 n=1 Tax=Oscarella lobularis TaxID=121494 RepID=UPI0033133B00